MGIFKDLMHLSLEDWIKQQEEKFGPLSDEEKQAAGQLKNLLNTKDRKEVVTTILDFNNNKQYDEMFAFTASSIGQSWNAVADKASKDFLAATKSKSSVPKMADI